MPYSRECFVVIGTTSVIRFANTPPRTWAPALLRHVLLFVNLQVEHSAFPVSPSLVVSRDHRMKCAYRGVTAGLWTAVCDPKSTGFVGGAGEPERPGSEISAVAAAIRHDGGTQTQHSLHRLACRRSFRCLPRDVAVSL